MRKLSEAAWPQIFRSPEDEGASAPAPAAPVADSAPAPAPAAAAQAAAAEPAKPEPPKPDWRDKRIAQLTAQVRAAATPAPAPAPAPAKDPVIADFEKRVADAAAAQAPLLAARAQFDRDCNDAVAKGRAEYGKEAFDAATGTLLALVTPNDQTSQAAYFNLLQSAIDAGEPAKLLFELGNDPDEAMRLMSLPPRRVIVELAKRSTAPTPAEVSSAPRPITPIEPRGGRHEELDPSDPERADTLSTADWMARRNKQVAASGAR